MSDQALTKADKPLSHVIRDNIRGKLRQSLNAMVWEGMTYDEAARSNGFTAAAMRKALAKPHVLAYLKAEREVLRSSAGPRNIQRLMQIRDAADNMPAVNAIKALEQLGDEAVSGNVQRSQAPGLVIQVVNVIGTQETKAPNPVQVIDNTESEQ